MTRDPAMQTAAALRRISAELRSGQYADAAVALRRLLDAVPIDPAVFAVVAQASGVARAWLTVGRTEDALTLLAPLAGSEQAGDAVLMLYGHALMALGRRVEAEVVLRRWQRRRPASADAALRLAAVLADTDRPAEAKTLARDTIVRHGETPEAAFVLGRALLGLAEFDAAEAAFRRVVQARPENQNAQANLMELIWMRSGSVRESRRAIDRTLRAQPQLVGLRMTLARLLTSAREHREALAVLEAGLALSPRDPALLRGASTIALEFDGACALAYAERLIQIAPHDRAAQAELGNASLAVGRAQAALDIATALHASEPTDGLALAMQADALRMLGDPRYRELLDYQDMVRAATIDVPQGWPDLTSYLAELVADLERSHTLHAHPIGNSLRGGSQIQLSSTQSPFRSIRAFPQAIDGPIRHYLQALGHGSDPMRRRNLGGYQLAGIWSVRLRPNGFHVNHYHPQGWISSACYLHLPPAVEARGGEGWLQLGEPAFPTTPALAPEFFIKPQPGLLALFPSYMWHGTVPFTGDPGDTRLTIAFDVLPAPERRLTVGSFV